MAQSTNPQHVDDFVIGKKVAAIIENRPSMSLLPLILHFSSVLGPEWPIVLFTSLSLSNFSDSAAFRQGIYDGRFRIQALPADVGFKDHHAVSRFLTLPWFWEQLAPADHVLMFQADSIICANSPQKVENYLKYDMIGAPIKSGMGQGYNGGLSLRNRNIILDIIKKHDWQEAYDARKLKIQQDEENARKAQAEAEKQEKEKSEKENQEQPQKRGIHTDIFPDNWTPPWEDYEDQWFFRMMYDLPEKWNGKPGANLPGEDVAKTFAVETVWYDKPLGYHQIGTTAVNGKEITDRMAEVEEWCPEYRLATQERFASAE